jgi:HlyD family secretion protein
MATQRQAEQDRFYGEQQERRSLLGGKSLRIGAIAMLVIVAAVAVYMQFFRPTQAVEEVTYNTVKVREGDLKISVAATGSLASGQEANLGFSSAGRVAETLVEVGQQVSQGDALLRLENGDAQAAVMQAETALRNAEIKREELGGEAAAAARDTALANLNAAELGLESLMAGPTEAERLAEQALLEAQQASVATAQASVASAQANLERLLSGPSPEEIAIAERKLELAKNTLWAAQAQRDAVCGRTDKESSGADCDVAQASVQKNDEEVRIAELQLQIERQGPTASEIATAEAQLQSARGQLANAQAQVQQAEINWLQLEAGADPEAVANAQARVAQAREAVAKLSPEALGQEMERAELAIQQAQVDLELARERLSRTALRAPYDGMVVDLGASVGEQVGTTPVVTLATTANPLVRFWVEETDLAQVYVDAPVTVSFRVAPDTVYEGSVTWVSPVLSIVDGVPSAEALAGLQEGEDLSALRAGMEADVEVIAALAENALLIPIDALRSLGEDKYAVFVVGEENELVLRPVEIGLTDFSTAQVTSGLSKGEVISTGTIDAN